MRTNDLTVSVPVGVRVLEISEIVGASVVYGCREGDCGTCMMKVENVGLMRGLNIFCVQVTHKHVADDLGYVYALPETFVYNSNTQTVINYLA